ncbi:MAG: cobalt-precorrin-6A reductase [Sulfitobacter sp.]|nr:cobalt-precorrin-6A reductase [Sulfitobacter sp.]
MRILLLGGTTEASAMAKRLAQAGMDSVFSYAGRTRAPMAQPLPTRTGGFGGVPGLRSYLREAGITQVIDATHPFAAGMSRNAFEACTGAGIPLIRLERPAWTPAPGDTWKIFDRLEDIPAALPDAPARIFLAIGKQQIGLFAVEPQHHYLLRLVDAPEAPLPLPEASLVIARGPFTEADDRALLEEHRITHIVAKNGGGHGARAKLDAARALGLPVLMAARPALPGDTVARDPEEVMQWLSHSADLGV